MLFPLSKMAENHEDVPLRAFIEDQGEFMPVYCIYLATNCFPLSRMTTNN